MLWMLLGALLGPAWSSTDDNDGDGYSEATGDCDDTDPTIYPHAPESCDGIDDDCDDTIDEGTPCFDDDGDGLTEEEGDCNDADQTINPNARELLNQIDDDCNGIIDDGTENHDDDGDGFSELEGDCDDDNPLRSPSLTDYCRDGIDNDCSGAADDDCIEDPADGCEPTLAVNMSSSGFRSTVGQTVVLDAFPIFDDAMLEPVLQWHVESGAVVDATMNTATWQLPDTPGLYLATVIVEDSCGFSGMDQLEIEVYTAAEDVEEVSSTGCQDRGHAILLVMPLLVFPYRNRRKT